MKPGDVVSLDPHRSVKKSIGIVLGYDDIHTVRVLWAGAEQPEYVSVVRLRLIEANLSEKDEND